MAQNYNGRYVQYPRPKQRRRRRIRWGVVVAELLMLVSAVGLLGWAARSLLGNAAQTPPPSTRDSPTAQPTAAPTVDSQPPQIMGVKDFLIYQGDPIDFCAGVTVSDDHDPAPILTDDSGTADFSKPGVYTVTYTALDASGNKATAASTVTVLEKRDGYISLETIYDAVDARLDAILAEPDMTVRQQVEAIYKWARNSLGYSGHMDKSDPYQAAYVMLAEGAGDCFGYWAVTKLMFDRLGIPNIDVQKVRNSPNDSDHYWSLISIDGGETYYHFDATPRKGSGDDFCLVTDAFLDAYSAEHKNSHNRDKSLYPATPEEAL